MRLSSFRKTRQRGIAIVIVMIVIAFLTMLAIGFAMSMRVEMTLARSASFDSDYEWLGRSGLELARYVLGQQMNCAAEPYDSLNQTWAGGPGGICTSNGPLEGISLKDVPLGPGVFSVKIVDMERKFNINLADDFVLRQALTLVGVNAADIAGIADSILDWCDPDNDTHINGTEGDYYLSLRPPLGPIVCKNGPIDDLTELMFVRGITPPMYYGGASHTPSKFGGHGRWRPMGEQLFYTNALVDLFTPISARFININTASAVVLQLLPGVDEATANRIIAARRGPDGTDGTEDDLPIPSVGAIPGLTQTGAQNARRFMSVRSATFEVEVTVEISGQQRKMAAVLSRSSPRDVKILFSHWK
ncbi:MAG: general secretion pathway protein GspK [Verrucomicrobia bacterium]|nr:general secretion pathway protein GspK [Verrucomicrobiota bacterium]